MRSLTILLALGLSGSAFAGSAPQKSRSKPSSANRANSLSLPPGWVVYSHKKPNEKMSICAGWSGQEWKVGLQQEKLAISPFDRNQEKPDPDPLPFKIIPGNPQPEKNPYSNDTPEEERNAYNMIGRRSQIIVKDGWLVGFNAGEFGGWLFWFSEDGKMHKRISEITNIVGLVKAESGVLALTGLLHASDHGAVYRIAQNAQGIWEAQEFFDLGSAPFAFSRNSSSAWLVATNRSLLRVSETGATELIAHADWKGLYPTSMTMDSTGDIYIGLRFFVIRLTKTNGEYQYDWLLPEGCRKVAWKEDKCICSGK